MTWSSASAAGGIAVVHGAGEYSVHHLADPVHLGGRRGIGEHERTGHRFGEQRIALHHAGDLGEQYMHPLLRRFAGQRFALALELLEFPGQGRDQ